ncbi:hypothetical protein HDU67_000434 [Dinochytrium kinnereticum]|nr:hypothetical protein HDU67_000434 [Dinochytrium kinnereticum]
MVRFKNRYLLFEVTFADGLIRESLHGGSLASVIKDSLELNFGDFGMGYTAQNFTVKYFSPYTGIGIVRVARDHFKMMWAAMTFVSQIKGNKCMINVIHVGGTIKQVQLQAIEHDKTQILEAVKGKNFEESQVVALLEKSKADIKALEN